MRIDWNETVAGLSMLEARDLLRKLRHLISKERLKDFVGPELDTSTLVTELIERGWVGEESGGLLQTTLTGNGVAQAKKLKPISRADAERLLQGVIAAVDEVNGDARYAHDVTELAVFGSYLGEGPELGDLDIGYSLKARWNQSNCDEVRERCCEAFPPPRSADFLRRLGWPEEVVLRKLAASNRVSLESMEHLRPLGFPHRMLRGG